MAGKVAERSAQVIIDKSAATIERSDTTRRGEASPSNVDFGLSGIGDLQSAESNHRQHVGSWNLDRLSLLLL
jgi:hypothetical protein